MSRKIAVECDQCNTQHMIDPGMDMPPYWVGIQICLGNQYGEIPEHEQDIIYHFCKKDCLQKFLNGEDIKRRLAMVDREEP